MGFGRACAIKTFFASLIFRGEIKNPKSMKEENWVEELNKLPREHCYECGDGAYIKEDLISLIRTEKKSTREETIKEIREKIKEKIYNPAISPRDSRIPDDPEQAADEAISYMHEKVNEILDTLTEKDG